MKKPVCGALFGAGLSSQVLLHFGEVAVFSAGVKLSKAQAETATITTAPKSIICFFITPV